MAQEDRNRLVEWYEVLQKQVPVVRQSVVDWLVAVREEPRLVWETPAVRYGAYVLGGLILVWSAAWFASSLAPPPPPSAQPPATTADFHVVCVNPKCHHHFVIHREMGFRDFPVRCPQCNGETGVRARRCTSETCKGRWVPCKQPYGTTACPFCGHEYP